MKLRLERELMIMMEDEGAWGRQNLRKSRIALQLPSDAPAWCSSALATGSRAGRLAGDLRYRCDPRFRQPHGAGVRAATMERRHCRGWAAGEGGCSPVMRTFVFSSPFIWRAFLRSCQSG